MSHIIELYKYKALISKSKYDSDEILNRVFCYKINKKNARNLIYNEMHKRIINLSDIEKILFICDWLHKNIIHDGDASFDKFNLNNIKINKKMNCYEISLLLNVIYITLGFKARMVQTMPFDPFISSNHWVNIVYIKSKWHMIDATFNAHCELDGNILSIEEIRKCIADNTQFKIFVHGKLNSSQYYYLLCETYYQFNTFKIHSENPLLERNQEIINLSPVGFDSCLFYKKQLELRKNDNVELNFCDKIRIFTHNPKSFWRNN